METNSLPKYDMSDKPTGCCPRFKPEGWDEQDLHFRGKRFLKARTRSILHIPINMGSVFRKVLGAIEGADAIREDDFIVLSCDPSPWTGEHYFSVSKEVPGHEMVELSGELLTKVFEGPYRDAAKWGAELEAFVKDKGRKLRKTYFFYTTCPKCAEVYGKNYVVGVAEIE